MIADGIYNPITGESVKVQGAGTVYNEEKNSLAIGKDTVAKGKDQFVLGRYNVEDSYKAEIVGGGHKGTNAENYPLGTDVSSVTGSYIQIYTCTSVYVGSSSLYGLKNALKRVLGMESTSGITTSAEASTYENKDFLICYKRALNSGVFKKSIAIMARDEDGVWNYANCTINSYNEVAEDAAVTSVNIATLGSANTDNSGKAERIYQKLQEERIFYKNIRTLDWSGNEKLAGNLEVGGTIKIGSTTITEEQLQALLATLN